MSFTENKNDRETKEGDKPSRKKPMYPVNNDLRQYLKLHGREVKLPVTYQNLLNYTWSTPIKDKQGKDTLWEKLSYDSRDWNYIREGLVKIYAVLKPKAILVSSVTWMLQELIIAPLATPTLSEYVLSINSMTIMITIILKSQTLQEFMA